MAQSKKKIDKEVKKTTNKTRIDLSNLSQKFKSRWDEHPSLFGGGVVILVIIIFLTVLFITNNSLFLAGQINGKFVTTPEFYSKLVTANGQKTWEQIVMETLIKQKAGEKGISASEKEINKKLKETQERFGGKEVFENTLAQNKTTIDQIKKQLEIQILMEKILEDKLGVSKEEIAKYRKENGNTVKDQTEDQIREAIKSQKLNEEFSKWYDENSKDATIKIYF